LAEARKRAEEFAASVGQVACVEARLHVADVDSCLLRYVPTSSDLNARPSLDQHSRWRYMQATLHSNGAQRKGAFRNHRQDSR
jgi:hypothetical protein